MGCVAHMGPYTTDDVMTCTTSVDGPGGPITQDLVLRTCGPIPWKIIAARILKLNPSLSTQPKLGGIGGLAMTSIADAFSLDLDLRHPWTSVFHLITRLRGFARRRLAAYVALWDEVYSAQAKSGSWPHVWAPCIHFDTSQEEWLVFYQDQSFAAGQAGLHPVHQYPFDQGHLVQYPENIRSQGWNRFYHGPDSRKCCADCTNTDPLNLTTGLSATLHGVSDYCRCGSYYSQFLTSFTSRVAILYSQPRPPGWPNVLLRDPGFWALILLEERLPLAVMNRLWQALLDGGIPKLLGRGDPALNYAIGTMMAHGGQVLVRNLLEAALQAVADRGDEIAGDDASAADIQSQMLEVARILADAGIAQPTGSPLLGLAEVLGLGGYQPEQLPLVQHQTTAGLTTAARNWAGMLHIETPRPITEAEAAAAAALAPPVEDPTQGRPPQEPVRASIAGPLILGASVLVAGLLGWKAWKAGGPGG